jgi:hypothetical protein
MMLAAIDKPDFKTKFITDGQSAHEIAALIVKGIRISYPQAKKIAHEFEGATKKESCFNVWKFLRDNVKYKAESIHDQTVKTIARIYYDRNTGNDCKHFTTFVSTILICLGIPVKLRLVSFNEFNKSPTHIYAVAMINGKELPIDAVINKFGVNPQGVRFKKDILLTT